MIIKTAREHSGSREQAGRLREDAASLLSARSAVELRVSPLKQAQIWGLDWLAEVIEREIADFVGSHDTMASA